MTEDDVRSPGTTERSGGPDQPEEATGSQPTGGVGGVDESTPTSRRRPVILHSWPEIMVAVLAMVVSLVSAFYFYSQTEKATDPRLEASLLYWYVLPGEFDIGDGVERTGAGTPIAVMVVTNTGRTAVTVGGIEQVDPHGVRHAILGTVLVTDVAQPDPMATPVFPIAAGQSVFVLAPLVSTQYWGSEATQLVIQSLDRTHTEVRVSLGAEPLQSPSPTASAPGTSPSSTPAPTPPNEGQSDEPIGQTCAINNNQTVCFAVAKMMPLVLATPDFPTQYWLCAPKYDVLDQVDSPEQRTWCQGWFTAKGWPEPER